jgi:hypothetical protein
MGYNHILLDEESQKLGTTILPWEKYQYRKLPMGIACSPDIFQSIMDELLGDLEFARVYINDILIVSDGTFEDHMDNSWSGAKIEVSSILSRQLVFEWRY